MPIITRKIELKIVRLTDEEYDQQWKYLYQINNTIYQAANRISTHCLFNDEYEMRLRLSYKSRYDKINKGLENIKTELEKLNTKKKTSDKEKRDRLINEQRQLVDERNELDYNPQIQISAESETKRSIFREKDKTKRSKKESAQHSKSRNKSFVMTSVSAL